jgi:hypothetical protein
VVEPTPPDSTRMPSSRWPAAGLGALGGAAVATVVTLAVTSALAPQPEPEPETAAALSVFEREALTIDDPDNLAFPLDTLFRDAEGSVLEDVDDVTLRWVGVADGHEVYAARWDHDGDVAICLILESTDQAAVACTTEVDFIESGIRMSASGVEVKWGPTDTDVWVTGIR